MKNAEIRIRCTPEFLAQVHEARGRESLTSFVTHCIEQHLGDEEMTKVKGWIESVARYHNHLKQQESEK